jgi:hypothetical protein
MAGTDEALLHAREIRRRECRQMPSFPADILDKDEKTGVVSAVVMVGNEFQQQPFDAPGSGGILARFSGIELGGFHDERNQDYYEEFSFRLHAGRGRVWGRAQRLH